MVYDNFKKKVAERQALEARISAAVERAIGYLPDGDREVCGGIFAAEGLDVNWALYATGAELDFEASRGSVLDSARGTVVTFLSDRLYSSMGAGRADTAMASLPDSWPDPDEWAMGRV